KCKKRLHGTSNPHAPIINDSNHQGDSRGDELSGGNLPFKTSESHRQQHIFRREGREKVTEICRKADRHGRLCARQNYHHARPTIEKTKKWTVRLAQEYVEPARAWIHRAHFGVGESAGD